MAKLCLVPSPLCVLSSDAFVDEALKVAKGLPGVETTVIRVRSMIFCVHQKNCIWKMMFEFDYLQGEELNAKGFGGIYHVGKAGPTPPAFVVLSYKPPGISISLSLPPSLPPSLPFPLFFM